MSLDESVELVKFAFNKANPGDIFVQKAPSASIHTIAKALLKIFDSDNEIKIIGTRHGEKLYETLMTREEMNHAEDLGDYFRIPADNRDLNYEQFFTEGSVGFSEVKDYNSHNTEQLDVDGVIEILLKLEYIKQKLTNNE